MRSFGRISNLGFGLLFSLVSASAFSHHGWSTYTNGDFSLTGTVVEKDFGNPHDRLTLEADAQQWNVVLSTPSRSRQARFSDGDVSVGDTVTAFGHRHADGQTFEMKTERLKVGDTLFDLYPNRS